MCWHARPCSCSVSLSVSVLYVGGWRDEQCIKRCMHFALARKGSSFGHFISIFPGVGVGVMLRGGGGVVVHCVLV